ncbi:MAG: class I SAM-dependent methyltransferase [Calditrichaeota bacterium]|nr:class I SAM-dependent methyltransferase [Calditrichota bacterium]
MTQFKDHFSRQSKLYSQYRPNYPDALFSFLANLAPKNENAWDCATGNGQAAISLVPYFEKIIATDASENQLAHAEKHPQIEYRVMSAEKTNLPDQCIDLITVAQAIHWFNFPKFFREANRVLKPDGILAVWTYNLPRISAQADRLLLDFYTGEINKYWPAERLHIEKDYQDIPFPYKQLEVPEFKMETKWTVKEIVGFLYTWSAVNKFIETTGNDPVSSFKTDFEKLFPDSKKKILISWPMTFLVGRK